MLPQIAGLFEPLFKSVGVSGDGALVYITAGLINIYAAIATINTLSFSQREITILALMCLISHNLPVEGAVQKKNRVFFYKNHYCKDNNQFYWCIYLKSFNSLKQFKAGHGLKL